MFRRQGATEKAGGMNVTINIDCSPEEARRFLGFPDLTPVHDAYVDKLKIAVTDGINPENIATMIQNWGPLSENQFKLWSKFFSQGGQ